jgi:DNA-binding response OmpR family regulator
MSFRYCAVNHPDFSDVGPKRTHLDTSRVFGSSYADPILLVDPNVALGRGLRHQLTRYGFCADLAITLEAARACAEHKYYHAMVVITDPSTSQALIELRQLRAGAPQTWIIVLAIKTADPASEPMLDFGADACLLLPFRFSDLLFRLESFAHRERAG